MSFPADSHDNVIILPIRLIDLARTLGKRGPICFTEPRGWAFHVISHTWSRDVRLWSSKIGKLLRRDRARRAFTVGSSACCRSAKSVSSSSSNMSSSYNELFESVDFGKDNAYDHFVKFLEVLRADGVESVWFDALCINQEDVEEKSREIKHMGAYYAQSLGCYVWAHGVGQGFSPWEWREDNSDGRALQEMGLPRWFSRVWTFQELLLPKSLVFLVELEFDERQMLVNAGTCFKLYSLIGHEMTYCCAEAVITHSMIGLHGREGNCIIHKDNDQLLAEVAVDAGSLVKAVFICARCGARVANSRQVSWRAMCLVERAAYMDLMYRAAQLAVPSKMARHDEQTLLRLQALVRKAHGELDDLALLRTHGMLLPTANYGVSQSGATTISGSLSLEPQVVLNEIGERHCSEGHDEDRVLSILGLLGVEEVAPVRAGRQLRNQILELANALLRTGNQKLMLKLCSTPHLSDYQHTPGMHTSPIPLNFLNNKVG